MPETGWVARKKVPVTGTVPEIPTVPETGWVLAEPSTFNGVIAAVPWTVKTSDAGVPAIANAGCFKAVAAPEGSGNERALTAWVAGKFPTPTVPETGCVAGKLPTETEPETGCVAGKFPTLTVPETGWVAGKFPTATGSGFVGEMGPPSIPVAPR